MRPGIQFVLPHSSPEQWAEDIAQLGFRAATFPVDYKAPVSLVDAYVKAAKERDILIAEVGVWANPFSTDEKEAARAREASVEDLRLADYIGARCCVNISGAFGPVWDFCYAENFTEDAYRKNLDWIRTLLDTARPQNTCYTLESMPWMLPKSPEETLRILRDVDDPHFKAHVDICNFVSDAEKFVHADELIDRCFDLLGGEIVSCHLKDIVLEQLSTVHITEVLPGRGKMNLRHYLSRIDALGDADMPVMIEHLPDRRSYELALAHVKSIWTF